MAYRRRRLVRTTKSGRLVSKTIRRRSPKHGSRWSSGFIGRAFNLNWLFGGNRHRRSV